MALKLNGVTLTWLGHDSFKINAEGVVLYIDPYELKGGEKADLVLITHEHGDHLDPASLKAITKSDTLIIAPAICKNKLSGNVKVVAPGDTLTEKGVQVKVVPAYNVRDDRQRFHPKTYGGIGYVVTVGGKSIYHAGDTDAIPEMSSLGSIDVALLPVSGTYVMTAQEAVEAVKSIKPKIAVPMHYGSIVGSEADAKEFKRLVGDLAKVEILTREKA